MMNWDDKNDYTGERDKPKITAIFDKIINLDLINKTIGAGFIDEIFFLTSLTICGNKLSAACHETAIITVRLIMTCLIFLSDFNS